MKMRRLFLTLLGVALLGSAVETRAANVLVIASSYHKGDGPFTSEIQTPLQNAGHTVTVWAQATQGWPTLDTLWDFDCVFFHGSERRRTGPIDSILTEFAAQGGRLVCEGSNLASYGGAYPEFEQHAIHADWQRAKLSSFTHQVVSASHPIAASLPATFTASGYAAGALPDKALPAHGATLVIQFQSQPGTAAVTAVPRQAYVCGSIRRVSTSGNARTLLVQNLIDWVMQDPDDTGIIDFGYELGTNVGQVCPVWTRIRNYNGSESGLVKLWASTDSSTWTAVDSSTYVLSGYDDADVWFDWTPAVESRYYLRVTLTATGGDAYSSNNAAGMLVTTFDQAVHPKLFFTAAEIPSLQSKASSTHLSYYQQLSTAVAIGYVFQPLPPEQWEDVNFSDLAQMVSLAALKAIVTPTPTYINNAKSKTLALCRYPHWETGNVDMDIYSGRACQALALAYDWLYPHFTKAERDTVQTKLKTQLQRLAAADPKWIWWSDAYTHNHNINSMSYLGAACYALYEEEPEAQVWESLAIDNLDNIMELYGPVTDGSWYEAMNYWGFISWTMLPHLWLLREQRGIDYFDTPWIQSMADYRIYGCMPIETEMVMLNESQHDEWYGPDDQLALFAQEYGNAHAQWLRQRVVNRLGYSLDGPLGFFFYDPNISQVVPTDKSWIATDQDTYFGRSAWADTMATFVTLKCGLPCGRHAYETYWGQGAVGGWEPSHFLPEQNGFTLTYGPDNLVQPAGLQSPLHRTYNTTSMLVNGMGQIGDSTKGSWPLPANELTMNPQLADTFMLKTLDYVVGDASTSYPASSGLTRFHRHLLYLRPDLVILVDDLKATYPSTFTFLLRNPEQIFTYNGSSVFMNGDHTDADMFMLSPTNRNHSISFSNYYDTSWGGYGLYLTNATPDTAVRFVNTFYPRRPFIGQAQLLYGDAGLSVVRVGDGTGYEATAAISHGHTGNIVADSLNTNASLAAVVRDPATGDFTYGAVRQATFLDWGTPARRLFDSPVPVDAEWTVRGDTLDVFGQLGTWTIFYAPNISFVWVNGVGEPFFQSGPMIEIGDLPSVPNGRVVGLTLSFIDEELTLRWVESVFFVNGVPTFPDFYDIYSSALPDSGFRLYDTVPGGTTSYSPGTGSDDQQFYYVVSRLRETGPAPLVLDEAKLRVRSLDPPNSDARGRERKH